MTAFLRRTAAFGILAIVCGGHLVLCGQLQAADASAARAARAGQLVQLKGHAVLRLYGPDVKERGFAHGYLLAPQIIECLDDALRSLPFITVERVNQELVPWATRRFFWDAECVAELDGVFEGMGARLGERGLVSAAARRAVTREDLYAINALADWFGPACSAFTAWGKLTGGVVLHGRNLDFPLGPRAVAEQIVLAVEALPARDGLPARKAWIGVGWPGLIGVYSAMNADGLVCCLHDATNVVRPGVREGMLCRGVLLRRMVEQLDPRVSDPAAAAAALAGVRPAACGNLFHLSWPKAAAERTGTAPAAVLEFDGADREPNAPRPAVAIRRPKGTEFLALTNHYCVRAEPLACERYAHLEGALLKAAQAGERLDVPLARKILLCAEQPFAAHTLVFLPDTLVMYVALGNGNVPSTRIRGTAFTFGELVAHTK